MNTSFPISAFIITLLLSCNTIKKKQEISNVDFLQTQKSITISGSLDISNSQQMKSIDGDRYIITGDFDGDGKKEKLIEHFVSRIDNKETNKYYEGDSIDLDSSRILVRKHQPMSFLLCDNKNIDTLMIDRDGLIFGPHFMKNEGDLNGDGTDEVSYVPLYPYNTNRSSYIIMTYKNKKWELLYSFSTLVDFYDGDADKVKRTVIKMKPNVIKVYKEDPDDGGIYEYKIVHLKSLK